ncbi:MAG: hypothetical protein AAGB14_05585 [Verrucomicrobiota bacterium]
MNPTFIPLTVAALCLPALAYEYPEEPREDGHRPRPPRPCFEALDTDGDKRLSESEIASAGDAILTLDKDGDGSVDLREILPPPPPDAPDRDINHRPPPPPIFMVVDSNRDGSISEGERNGASEAISRLDHNEDGEIDGREAAPRPPHRRGGGEGHQRQPFGEGRDGPPHGHPPHPLRGSGR